ncbi:hypothetical protein FQA39_LY12058 [Lamprigera yunnana]|nr:hypothetical protein FQA39_LY12058 [Lamprigera yunnana]
MRKAVPLMFVAFFTTAIVAEQEDMIKATIEKLELISFNDQYIKNPKITIFQYNATHQAVNSSGTLLKDLGVNVMDNIEVYSIESNGPRLMTIAKDINVCEIMSGGYPELEDLFKYGNFTKCPIKAGYYETSNAIVDTSKIPPSAPRGSFLLDIKTSDGTIKCNLNLLTPEDFKKVNVTPNLQIENSNLEEIQDINEYFVGDKIYTDYPDSENTDFDYNIEDLVEEDTDCEYVEFDNESNSVSGIDYEIAKSENKDGEIYEITIEDESCQKVQNIKVNRETDESNENQEARPRILYLKNGYKIL